MQLRMLKLLTTLTLGFSCSAFAAETTTTNILNVAVGSYEIESDQSLPIVLTQRNLQNQWVFDDMTNLTQHAYLNATECMNDICIVAGANEFTSGYNRSPLIAVNDGKEWQLSKINSLPSMVDGFINSLACATNSICLASGFYQNTNGSFPLMLFSNDTGRSWNTITKIENLPKIDHANLESVTCENNLCVAVGYSKANNYREKPLILKSSDQGVNWSAVDVNGFSTFADYVSLHRVKCHENVCTAVGHYGNYSSGLEYPLVVVSNDAGITWNTKSIAKVPPKNTTIRLNDVAVIGQDWIAVGNNAISVGIEKTLIVTSQDNGKTWAVKEGSTLSGTLEAVSCNNEVCATAGTANYYNRGRYLLGIFVSKDKGSSWNTIANISDFDTQYAFIQALKCNENSCIATGGFSSGSNYQKPLLLTCNKNGDDWVKLKAIINLPDDMYEVNVKAVTH